MRLLKLTNNITYLVRFDKLLAVLTRLRLFLEDIVFPRIGAILTSLLKPYRDLVVCFPDVRLQLALAFAK